ncbi:MAG: hypothetical protein ACLP05_04475 [Candidatus Kryptoniota bacterium]
MRKGFGKILGALALIGALVGVGSGPVKASVPHEKQTTPNAPLYLEHSTLHNGNSGTLLADHESHYSHSSHASHVSHQSGY